MSQFLMPSLGADMEAGTLVEMLKSKGDDVHRGDIIAAVETQKGVIEIEVFEDGVMGDWFVDLGTKVPVGTPLAMIETAADAPDEPTPPQPEVPQPTDPQPQAPDPEAPQPYDPDTEPPPPEDPQTPPPPATPVPDEDARGARPRITPAARRRAAREGLDLSDLKPGPDQTISLSYLDTLIAGPKIQPLSAMRQAISAAMSRSKREIPHYYLSQVIDLTAAEAFVATENAERPPETRLLLAALFVKAIAKASRKYPEFNGFFQDATFSPSDAVNIGMAINLRGGGLVAPALHDADTLELDDLMIALRDLTARVKAGRFRARELSDPTITLTSLGERGVETIYGVIFPPQVAIVGIGTPAQRAVVHEGQITSRLVATVTLSADHRVSDGHRGALFLNAINTNLQRPQTL
jgi:pyruvate dehydrogenase E2 component (dihydrolipoamide acetyltransferase)